MGGGWAVDMRTYQTPNMDTSNTKYGYENTHQRCQRKTQTHKQTF